MLEREELFAKGTGESTDIVQKEMYTFTDKGGERVTMRPEATPSMVRAFVEHCARADPAVSPKLYSLGPMFRYERPQKGRYRQFHQLDVEAFGVEAPVGCRGHRDGGELVRELRIDETLDLLINSVGCPTCRPRLQSRRCGRRWAIGCRALRRLPATGGTNPLRIFDCKVPADQPIIDALPHSEDYLCRRVSRRTSTR